MSSFAGSQANEEDLLRAIDSTPIIDNHAHPLLKLENLDKFALLSIATEASGDAIESSRSTLAHLRAVNQLSKVLGCSATWEAVSAAIAVKRKSSNHQSWVQRCMSGIEAVLVDDGLGDPDLAESYQFFDQFTPSKSKRIVRIEYEATLILKSVLDEELPRAAAWEAVAQRFDAVIQQSNEDPEVVGFKSVICYRTGLDIGPRANSEAEAIKSFASIHDANSHDSSYVFGRLSHRGLNEYFVHRLAQLIQGLEGKWKKPIQFHTGLGDNDITLAKSNPSHLQSFIREYEGVPLVLLHASYPFTREAGYLAAMYSHVYADIGEVFPFVSREGQLGIIKQILELCPVSKILWSTDGHWFPETYLLAVDQMRVALKAVLHDLTRCGDLSYNQAIQLVEDILFNNSNNLYNLGLVFEKQPGASTQPLQDRGSSALDKLGRDDTDVQFLRICWLDMTSTPRLRVMPLRRVRALMEESKPLSMNVVSAGIGILQNDTLPEGSVPIGEMKIIPDWTTLRPGPRKGHAVVRGYFEGQDGSHVKTCPRTVLKRILDVATDLRLEFMVGFEIEFVLLERREDQYSPLDTDGHAWCVGRSVDNAAAAVLEEAFFQLEKAGIHLEVMHAESARGAYEFVLPKKPVLEAVDTLLFTREVISTCATSRGYKMTLHPKPFADQGGIASHAHISISSPGGDEPGAYEHYYAGILKHLRGLLAFTCSSMASYDRIQDGCWAGGTWIAWGTNNRETALRKISGSHWELKCMDGTANPYLALAAVIGAGVNGLRERQRLLLGDCNKADPAMLSDAERESLGIRQRLPRSLKEAIEALKQDVELTDIMGQDLVELYAKVKEAEMEIQGGMEENERLRWVIERY